IEADYSAIPHAVYGHPQIASVGLTENQAKEKVMDILVGKYYYRDTAKGSAIGEEDGFFKVIVEKETNRLLGGHIIGPYAPILIQEVINALSSGDKTFYPIVRGLHIHPALTEVVQWSFGTLKEP
ncbi:MAG: dihydrolipoyl dehydrogenase, partial [Candidatus Bathyarchaeota archaeon]